MTRSDSADGIVGAPDGSLLFAQETLYAIARGAEGAGDQPNARSMYRIAMLAAGFKGRAK
jgi:hypothetical protein